MIVYCWFWKRLVFTFVFITDFEEFQTLLGKQSPIEAYTEWLDDIIDKCVLQVLNKDKFGTGHPFYGSET